ncbi:MAG: zinc-ribbon domain-containing protein [Alphaproteobacteria bacterium]|nr:zinc-ribbon domain-containing protein [Alphaproteobacteria bacterium]
MKIYCPKCNTCYSIDETLIPTEGKKVRCQRCGEIWVYKPQTDSSMPLNAEDNATKEKISFPEDNIHEDVDDSTIAEAEIVPDEISETLPEEAPQTIAATEDGEATTTPATTEEKPVSDEEINKIFSRLKDETDKLSEEKSNLSKPKKIFQTIKKLLGWNNRLIISLEILTILLIIGLGAFAQRFEIVRKFPQMEAFFGQLGLQTKVIGEGLDFQNVTRNYIVENDEERLNIKGFIVNTKNSELELPVVVVNFLNNDAELLSQTEQKLETATIKAGEKVPFNLYTTKPTDDAKFVVLTFK